MTTWRYLCNFCQEAVLLSWFGTNSIVGPYTMYKWIFNMNTNYYVYIIHSGGLKY